MIKKLFNQKGTTMVELLIYMGLLAILLAILTDMFVAVLNLKADMNVTSFNEQDGRFILARLEQDISDSQSITTPNTNGSTTSTLSIVKAGVTYSYVASGDYFQLTNNAGTFNLNSSETKIENVSFKRLGNGSKDTVQIKYTVTSKILKNGKYDSINFQTTVGIR
jgi:Tfp pilus assembly protein PilW